MDALCLYNQVKHVKMGIIDWGVIQGTWEDLKNTVIEHGSTIEELWDTFKYENDDVFTKGCEAISGIRNKPGCCRLNQVVKCSARSIEFYGNDLKNKVGDSFTQGCESIGGSVRLTNTLECDVDGKTFSSHKFVRSGGSSIEVSIHIVTYVL